MVEEGRAFGNGTGMRDFRTPAMGFSEILLVCLLRAILDSPIFILKLVEYLLIKTVTVAPSFFGCDCPVHCHQKIMEELGKKR